MSKYIKKKFFFYFHNFLKVNFLLRLDVHPDINIYEVLPKGLRNLNSNVRSHRMTRSKLDIIEGYVIMVITPNFG